MSRILNILVKVTTTYRILKDLRANISSATDFPSKVSFG